MGKRRRKGEEWRKDAVGERGKSLKGERRRQRKHAPITDTVKLKHVSQVYQNCFFTRHCLVGNHVVVFAKWINVQWQVRVCQGFGH